MFLLKLCPEECAGVNLCLWLSRTEKGLSEKHPETQETEICTSDLLIFRFLDENEQYEGELYLRLGICFEVLYFTQ